LCELREPQAEAIFPGGSRKAHVYENQAKNKKALCRRAVRSSLFARFALSPEKIFVYHGLAAMLYLPALGPGVD
jgi:hypothetical protein